MTKLKKIVLAAVIGIGAGIGSASAGLYQCEDYCAFEAQACHAAGTAPEICRAEAHQCMRRCWGG